MDEALAGTDTAASFRTARSETVYLTAVDADGNGAPPRRAACRSLERV